MTMSDLKIKVVDPPLRGAAIVYTPLEISRVTATPEGLDLHHGEMRNVPYTDLRLVSVLYGENSPAGRGGSPRLLLFVREQRRPCLVPGSNIQYGDFPFQRAETVTGQLRGFTTHLRRMNPQLAVDRSTFDFLGGKPLRALDRDVLALCTALGETLRKADEGSDPSAPDELG